MMKKQEEHQVLVRFGRRHLEKHLAPALLLLMVVALVSQACHGTQPGGLASLGVSFAHSINHGLAVSLNALQANRESMGGKLPGMRIRGVMFDRSHNDWVVFGDADPQRPGLPVDAVAIALRAIRDLDAPGIDIRPRAEVAGKPSPVQQVQYFGPIQRTVVARWFFAFDDWMKLVSLAKQSVPVAGVPIYWQRAVEELEREVQGCDLAAQGERTRSNRWWLCACSFKAVESDDTLTFEETPLRVLAEDMSATNTAARPASPCDSRGTDDRLAADYANWLTAHLDDLRHVAPVSEIEGFAQLMAGFAWLMQVDPYRDLTPWLNGPLPIVETPRSVPTVTLQAERQHFVERGGQRYLHTHRIEVSGGVVIVPALTAAKVTDDSLQRLRSTVLAARPAHLPVKWPFTFNQADSGKQASRLASTRPRAAVAASSPSTEF